MPIQFPNFLSAPIQKPDYSGIADVFENYYAGKNMPNDALIEKVKAQFAQPNAEEDLQNKKLKNIYQSLVNKYTPEDYQSTFDERKALGDYRMSGGGRAGVTTQQQRLLQQQLMKDNPNFTPDQAFEAAGNLVQGNSTLSDGTPFKVSGLTGLTASKAVLQGTTASLATKGTQAAQAHAEIQALEPYAQSPFGDTYGGYSPDQIIASLSNDPQDQKKLGQFIASQALQYEIAQNRNRLAMGQPGVSSTEELMKMSGQLVKTRYPKLSAIARKEANDHLDRALSAGLDARQKIGVLQSSLSGSLKPKRSSFGTDSDAGIVNYKIVNGKLVRG